MRQTTFHFYETDETLYQHEYHLNDSFSHGNIAPQDERQKLEQRYADLFVESSRFSRKLVSYQGNKTEILHSWVKYREGFSASLVEIFFDMFGIERGRKVLDPFAGSCTTLLVAKMLGIDAVGIELLPHCHLAWEMKSSVYDYDLAEIDALINKIQNNPVPATNRRFPHLSITESAFPSKNEQDLMAYIQWGETIDANTPFKTLYKAVLMNILEDISYTRKDGQYLRWDRRAQKIIDRNKIRITQGKKPIKGIHKGEIPSVREVLLSNLKKIRNDIAQLQKNEIPPGTQELIQGNTLHVLPQMADAQFDFVMTSPPYANRYDYTRTYALELAYLGVGDGIFDLRQEMLSCTVENRPKYLQLAEVYKAVNRYSDYERVLEILDSAPVLKEITNALKTRNARGEINNKNVISMIEQYFGELTFVFFELFRTSKKGAHVVFVNDNVRYAGEVIPVDVISTQIAEQIGFTARKIYVLPQRKGNSSQQMKKFGRRELRKSITVWEKI